MRSLVLVRHAPTSATRAAAFPADEELDERGRELAAGLAAALPRRSELITSPARRCRQTAEAAGLAAAVDERIAECDFGTWAGRSLADVNADEPAAVQSWMLDPGRRPARRREPRAVLHPHRPLARRPGRAGRASDRDHARRGRQGGRGARPGRAAARVLAHRRGAAGDHGAARARRPLDRRRA